MDPFFNLSVLILVTTLFRRMTSRVVVVLAALTGGAAFVVLYRSRKQQEGLLEEVEALKAEVAKAKQLRCANCAWTSTTRNRVPCPA